MFTKRLLASVLAAQFAYSPVSFGTLPQGAPQDLQPSGPSSTPTASSTPQTPSRTTTTSVSSTTPSATPAASPSLAPAQLALAAMNGMQQTQSGSFRAAAGVAAHVATLGIPLITEGFVNLLAVAMRRIANSRVINAEYTGDGSKHSLSETDAPRSVKRKADHEASCDSEDAEGKRPRMDAQGSPYRPSGDAASRPSASLSASATEMESQTSELRILRENNANLKALLLKQQQQIQALTEQQQRQAAAPHRAARQAEQDALSAERELNSFDPSLVSGGSTRPYATSTPFSPMIHTTRLPAPTVLRRTSTEQGQHPQMQTPGSPATPVGDTPGGVGARTVLKTAARTLARTTARPAGERTALDPVPFAMSTEEAATPGPQAHEVLDSADVTQQQNLQGIYAQILKKKAVLCPNAKNAAGVIKAVESDQDFEGLIIGFCKKDPVKIKSFKEALQRMLEEKWQEDFAKKNSKK